MKSVKWLPLKFENNSPRHISDMSYLTCELEAILQNRWTISLQKSIENKIQFMSMEMRSYTHGC